jgi:hypothetical protein
MIEGFESPMPIDSRVIDRLVDGELTASEERSLLGSLEFQPDGWRRCALAFLESRVWKNELAAVTRGQTAPINGTPVVLSPLAAVNHSAELTQRPASSSPWVRGMAIAASIGLAFVLGVAVRDHWNGAANNHLVAVTDEPDANLGKASRGAGSSNSIDTGALAFDQPTITMAVIDHEGDVERQLEIPVVETDTFDPRWLQRPPSAIPHELASALRRSGHSVEEQRLYVPVLLDDGRQAIIPLDQAEVRFREMSY